MRNKLYFFIALISCAAVSLVFAQGAAGEKKIKEVRIVNNRIVSSATIRAKMKTREGAPFSQEMLNEDLKRLYGLGFFDDIAIDVQEEEGGYIVSFVVTEKPVLDAIVFEGNKVIKEPKLRKEISSVEGDIVDHVKLSRDLTAIRKLYESQGFQLANVDYKMEVDESINRAKVTFVINEKQRIRVMRIDFNGNYSIKEGELKKLMVTKARFLFFVQPGYFKADEFEADMQRITLYYQQKGFLDVKADADVEYNTDGTEMYITVNVEEGKRYLVGSVDIAGAERFPEYDIRKVLTLTGGDPFSEIAMRENAQKIQQYYFDEGYMNCAVAADRALDAATGDINITYTISEGRLVYIDKIVVQGNNKTKDVVIRRELRVYPGEEFRGALIRRSKERLYNLGYFEEVLFETEPGSAPDRKNLVVTVKETKTGELSFGGGYSSVDSLLGFVQVTQRNFDALNFPTFTGGGQILNIRAELGGIRQNYVVSWTDPWIFGFPYLFGFDIFRTEHEKTRDVGYLYDELRQGGDLRFGKEITDYLRADAMYKLENIDISDVSSTAAAAIKEEEGTALLSRGTFSMKYDTRDNIFTPTRGHLVGVGLENAGGPFGGDKDFVKYGASANKYYSFFSKKLVLSLFAGIDLADAYGDTDKVPVFERYYAGGANTIRGYKERYVGPRDTATNDPIGGNARVLANAEATFPLVEKMIKGAVFLDAGEVWADKSDIFTSNLKVGTGVGARVKTPVGPVKLDYGWPLSDNRGDKKKGRFYFSMSHGF